MIKILVDSASDCKPQDSALDYFMPISVTIDGKSYQDGIDLDADKFYGILTSTKDFPQTSQPAPQSFIDLFSQIKEAGDELIYFALSSALSGTYQGALMAKEMVEYDKIYVVDTKAATHMIGVLAGYAKKRIAEGASAEEIVSECEELKGKIKIFAGLDTLEYLRRGGRLSAASAVIGGMAQVKPIITVTEEGKVSAVGKGIGVGRAMQFILDKVAGYRIDSRFPVYALYTYGTENVEDLRSRLNYAGVKVDDVLQIGSTIGAHVGPGVYAVMFVAE